MEVPCGSSPTTSWPPRLTYSNLVFPAQDSVSPFAKTRITKLQRNKCIHPGCFQEETAQNREGGVLLGKLLTASRMTEKKQCQAVKVTSVQGLKQPLGPGLHPPATLSFQAQPGSQAQLRPQREGRASQPEPHSSPLCPNATWLQQPVLSGKHQRFSGTRSVLGFGLDFTDATELRQGETDTVKQ